MVTDVSVTTVTFSCFVTEVLVNWVTVLVASLKEGVGFFFTREQVDTYHPYLHCKNLHLLCAYSKQPCELPSTAVKMAGCA